MKKILVLGALLLMAKAHAQLTLQSGSSITVTGNTLVTLQDVDLVNNGIINQTTGTGRFLFTGTAYSSVGGSNSTAFDLFEIAKAGNSSVRLAQNIKVNSGIQFTSGNIDLNRNNIELQPEALLIGESEASRINGASGGYVEIAVPLNAPSSANPGNLGAVISSSENLGETVIHRGHVSQKAGAVAGNSIERYYDILPANTAALNVAVSLNYFGSELNGLTKNSLQLFKSADNNNWTKMDLISNTADKKTITRFSRWTLFADNNAIPGKNTSNDFISKSIFANTDVKIYPNPVQDQFSISMAATESAPLLIKVVDAKGATVYMKTKSLQQGSNALQVDIRSLPAANYFLYLEWNNGRSKKTISLLKQK